MKNSALAVDSSGSNSGLEAGDDAPQQAQIENEPDDDDEEDEETTCSFCLFHRRGPCGMHFRRWEK